MRPMRPARSSSDRRITDTVAVTMAHGRILPAFDAAPASDEPRVGLPPFMRSSAPNSSAVLKKMVTYASAMYMANMRT